MAWKIFFAAIAFLLIFAFPSSGFAGRHLPLPSVIISIPSDIALEMARDPEMRRRIEDRIVSGFIDRYQECSLAQIRPIVAQGEKKLIIAVIVRCRALGRDRV